MAAIEFSSGFRAGHFRYDFAGSLGAGWRAFVAHRRERRELVALSRLPGRVLRDMGFDPEQVYAALDGSWDKVDPAAYRGHYLPKERV